MSNPRRNFRPVGYLVLGLCLAVVYAAGFGVYQLWARQQALRQSPGYQELGIFWETWDILEQDFFGELPTAQERTYGAIRELLVLLDDPYTIFVEPQPRIVPPGVQCVVQFGHRQTFLCSVQHLLGPNLRARFQPAADAGRRGATKIAFNMTARTKTSRTPQ